MTVALVFLLLAACQQKKRESLDDLIAQEVTLPGGQVIQAEVMVDRKDQARGMMFRTSLAPDHGMLFIHQAPGSYAYWMYQTLIPLDIIWMDENKRIVEISADTPPCRTVAHECATYGGHQTAKYVIELAGGMAKKYGLREGALISF
jgi:uncharacterized membrane protein (UPF0127 family)